MGDGWLTVGGHLNHTRQAPWGLRATLLTTKNTVTNTNHAPGAGRRMIKRWKSNLATLDNHDWKKRLRQQWRKLIKEAIWHLFKCRVLDQESCFQLKNKGSFSGTPLRRHRWGCFWAAPTNFVFRRCSSTTTTTIIFFTYRTRIFSGKKRHCRFAHTIAINLLPTHANRGDQKGGDPKPSEWF